MYVPRFGKTNIVYDVINNTTNNILTTTTDKTYGTITIQDGILTHSNDVSNFNSPTGILYGSDTGGKWSLASTKITNGILTKSNDLTFDSHTGLLYGKSTGKQTWSLDSVIIDKGILTKSNNTLGFSNPTGILYGSDTGGTWSLKSIDITDGIFTRSNNTLVFNSLTGILYGSATNDIWSLESTKITDGIFTRSNNALVFNNPNGLLYGNTTAGKWSLNNVNDPTPYEDDKDYVLYYGKDANKVTPHWRLLRINGKNFITDNTIIQNQWNNIVVDPTTCNIISIQTERLEQQDYGLYNHNGKVVKLSPKVLNDIGFKIFPSSEINETGYVTTNVIIYNSSITDVTLPVNYYNVINFHSNEQNNSNSNMFNITYTKGFYNYITVSNSLPIYDQVKNTYTGFYNFINSNIYNNDTNDTNTNNYLHFTTTLNVDSIYMPKPDPNVKYFTYVNDEEQLYNFNIISNYKCIISISTNFSKIQTNTFYQNMFFCNPTTPVLSNENTDVLLGYLIVDLSTIDKSTGKVNINQLIDIDSTIPYNTNINNLTVEELKNGLLTFKPQYYISNNNSIISLYYNDNTDGIFTNISEISINNITLNNNPLQIDTDYTYNNKYLRLNNKFFVNSNTNELYKIGTIIIPTRGIESSVYDSGKTTVNLKYLYCDTSENSDIYNIDNCLQPYTYIETTMNGKQVFITNPALGYTSTNTDLCRVYLNTALPFSQPAILLNPAFYDFDDGNITNKITSQKITIFSDVSVGDDNVITINDDTVVNFDINEFNDLVYNNDSNISFLHDTYIFNRYIQIDNSLLYINSETSNIHALVMPNNDTVITSRTMNLNSGSVFIIPVTIYFSNNLYTSRGKYKNNFNDNTFNSNLYTIVDNNNTILYIYETRPIIYNKNYIFHNDLIVKYYNNALINTPEGIIYNNHYIFSKHDMHINALGQIAVNTDKYYYNNNESAIYSIYNDSKYVLSSGDNIDIVYRQYIELTDKNFFISSFTNRFTNGDINESYLLCKTLIPLNSLDISTYPINNTIRLITDHYYGLNSYGDKISLLDNRFLYGKNALINKLPFISNSDVQNIQRNNTTIKVTLTIDNPVILTQQGLSIVNKYITKLTTTDGIIFTDEYTDIPLFDTPIEKDIKVVLKPINKYSILSYNNISYTDQIYTLAKNVGFKISLCNIYVTLTSYIGEYPSMIN